MIEQIAQYIIPFILFFIFTLGIIVLPIKIILGALSYRWKIITAKVVESSLEEHCDIDSSRKKYTPFVKYEYYYKGNKYTGNRFTYKIQSTMEKTTANFIRSRFSPNDNIEIRVCPTHPYLSVIEHGINAWNFVGLVITFGFWVAVTHYLYPDFFKKTVDILNSYIKL